MKKILMFFMLSMLLLFSLSSCGGKDDGPISDDDYLDSPDFSVTVEDVESLDSPDFSVAVENEMIVIEIDEVEYATMYEIQVKDFNEESEWFDVITTDKLSWAGSFVWGNHGFHARVRAVHENSDGTMIYSEYTEINDIENIFEFDSDNPPIAEALPEGDSYHVYEGELAFEGQVYVEKCLRADNDAGFMATIQTESYGGVLTTVVVVDKEGTVRGVKVMHSSDTQGVGTKAMTPEYLDQYEGLTEIDSMDVKNDSNIGYISGASVSSNAVHTAVYYALEQYKLIY